MKTKKELQDIIVNLTAQLQRRNQEIEQLKKEKQTANG